MAVATTNYGSTTDTSDLTITLASLATSSSMTAGRQSTVVSNISDKFMDVLVSGQITTGTSPTTGKTIAIYVFAPIDVNSSTFVYPVAGTTALGESDAAATFDAEQRNMLRQGASITINATSDRKYPFSFSIASLFGAVPLKWGLWVTHDTAVNLNSTSGNHWITYTGIKYEI